MLGSTLNKQINFIILIKEETQRKYTFFITLRGHFYRKRLLLPLIWIFSFNNCLEYFISGLCEHFWRNILLTLKDLWHGYYSKRSKNIESSHLCPHVFLIPNLLFFKSFWPYHMACGNLVSQPEINPVPLCWQHGVSTTGPP